MLQCPVQRRQPSPVAYDDPAPHRWPRLLRDAVQPLQEPRGPARGRVRVGEQGALHRQGQAVPRQLAARAGPRLRARRRRGSDAQQADPGLPAHRQALHVGPPEGHRRHPRPRHRRAGRLHPRPARALRAAHRHAGAPVDPRPRRLEPARCGAEALPLRGGAGPPARARAAPRRAPRAGRSLACRSVRRDPGGLRRPPAVRAHRGTARDRRGRRGRAGPRPPDEPAPPGRGRLRQDVGGGARDAPGRRLRRAGGAARSDGGPGPAAPPLHLRDARRPRAGRDARRGRRGHVRRAAHRVDGSRGPPGGDAAHRDGRGRDRHRHPRTAPGHRRVRRPRSRGGRRAAPLRCGATGRADRQGRHPAPCPGDDGDADPAHGRDDRLRRPRDLRAGRAARRTRPHPDQRRPPRRPADLDRAGVAAGARGGREGPPGLRRVPAHLR